MEFSLIFFDTAKQDCVIKTRKIFSFLTCNNWIKNINNWLLMDYFFIAKHINDDIIKYDQYFAFLIWIASFNVFINIMLII